ncbi:MAG: hypothetical protein AAF744_05095 [Pseudomonadota bacterium]
MSKRFEDLRKVPKQPAARLLAMANAKLKTPLDLPASASVSEVMAALDAASAFIDQLRLMGVALPARERTWWACLAARDVVGEVDALPATLELAEAWVRKPSDALRDKVRAAMEVADVDDDTTLCGTCVLFYNGKLGTGDLAELDGPPGATEAAAFGMNVMALGQGDSIPETAKVLVDRALDIARGGNGQIPLPGQPVKEEEQTT